MRWPQWGWSVYQGLLVAGFVTAALLGIAAGPLCPAMVIVTLLAAMGAAALCRAGVGRGVAARLCLTVVAALALAEGAAAAVIGWQTTRVWALHEAQLGQIGPQGMDELHRAVWAVLIGSVGAMVASAVGGGREAWRTFAWYTWAYALVAAPAFLASHLARDCTYDIDKIKYTSWPQHAILVGDTAAGMVLAAAVVAALFARVREAALALGRRLVSRPR